MIDHLVETDSAGVHLHRICHGAGLGGTPYRDGTFKYYVEEKVVSDVMMGLAPFMFAGMESEKLVHLGK